MAKAACGQLKSASANWVIAALRKEGTGVFPVGSTSFEVSYNDLGRRYDAVVQKGANKIFYEFKSYSRVPPANFAEQFVKDLNNPDILTLDQLKWYFDADKNPPNFETNMKAAIDGLDLSSIKIPSSTLQRLGVNGETGLRILLENNFSSIFNLQKYE